MHQFLAYYLAQSYDFLSRAEPRILYFASTTAARPERLFEKSFGREKANLVAERADWIRRMHKSPDQMNVRVHRAVSDLQGATGMAMIRAIVS